MVSSGAMETAIQWVDEPPRALGTLDQEDVTEDNALDVLRQEAPCYSRRVHDCLTLPDELQRRGMYDDRCRRIDEASQRAPADGYDRWLRDVPFCPDYFERTRPGTPSRLAAAFAVGALVGVVLMKVF